MFKVDRGEVLFAVSSGSTHSVHPSDELFVLTPGHLEDFTSAWGGQLHVDELWFYVNELLEVDVLHFMLTLSSTPT